MPLRDCSPRSSKETPAEVRGKAADDVGDEDFAGGGEPADARSDVYRPAVDVVVLADDVAGVEAKVQREAALIPSLSRTRERLRSPVARW